jgi:hypothetical protein
MNSIKVSPFTELRGGPSTALPPFFLVEALRLHVNSEESHRRKIYSREHNFT